MPTLKSGLKIGKKIGAGSFGEVFVADDPVHGRVAVKRLEKDPTKSDAEWDDRKKGLMAEAQHLKQATHRNVVQVYHLLEDEAEDAILFVMECCDGGSLQAAFDDGPMRLGVLRKVATEITQGLQALHARGMLHRDIKPGNILINNKGLAKIGDFGLVTDDIVLGYGSQAGYWDHIAPEIYAGGGTSVRTDIWALGMTLYRLLHGAVWYAESPPPRTAIPQGNFANRLRWLPHVPKKWRRTIRAMLRDDPAKRYQTATEVFSALGELPTEPDWVCTVSAAEVRWERSKGSRRIFVVWQRTSHNHHTWRAWSEAIGAGRSRTLGGSTGVVGRTAAERALQAFFDASS